MPCKTITKDTKVKPSKNRIVINRRMIKKVKKCNKIIYSLNINKQTSKNTKKRLNIHKRKHNKKHKIKKSNKIITRVR